MVNRQKRDLNIPKCFHSVPSEWKIMKLKDLTSQITDGVHATPEYVDNGIPFLSVNNLSKDRLQKTW